MYHEIERKFLVTKIPHLKGVKKVSQERYFIQRGDIVEEGLKRKDEIYLYEHKVTVSGKEKSREKKIITQDEFEKLKAHGTRVIERDSYTLTDKSPLISIKEYKGIYKGLVLAEVEFDSLDEMEMFKPLPWMGAEVTSTKLGKDARLVDLDREHFKTVLHEIESNYNFKGIDK
jgi:CYTH domain-containing protein